MRITASDYNYIARQLQKGENIEKIIYAFKEDLEAKGEKFTKDDEQQIKDLIDELENNTKG